MPDGYGPIAAGKLAGEVALRNLAGELAQRGIDLIVVSGDMIAGTIVVRLLERRDRAAVAARRDQGPLPTVAEFASAVAAATRMTAKTGHTVYVGGADFTGTNP